MILYILVMKKNNPIKVNKAHLIFKIVKSILNMENIVNILRMNKIKKI